MSAKTCQARCGGRGRRYDTGVNGISSLVSYVDQNHARVLRRARARSCDASLRLNTGERIGDVGAAVCDAMTRTFEDV